MSIIQRVPWRVQPQVPVPAVWPVPAQIVFNPGAGYVNIGFLGSGAQPKPVGAALLTPWQGEMTAAVGSSSGADRVSFGASTALSRQTYSGLIRFWATTSAQAFFFETQGPAIGGFEIAVNGTSIAIDRANAAVMVSSSNAFVVNGWNTVAFSTNGTSGRNRIALNGVITSSTTTGTYTEVNDIRLGAWYNNTAGQLFYASALIISTSECLDDAFLTRVSRSAQEVWQLFAPQTRRLFVSGAVGGDPALTGSAATASAGTVTPALALATTGNSATATVGAPVAGIAIALAGNSAAASAGNTVAAISIAVAGNLATASVGTVAVSGTTQAITGNAATSAVGTPIASISLALTGNSATASPGTVTPATADVTLALSGNGTTASAGVLSVSDADSIIGRKYPRRGRSRPRKTEDVAAEDIPKISAKISKEREEITRELVEVQAALVSSKLMADNSVNRTQKIKKLGDAISGLESELRMKRQEEELFMMLTLMVLED